MCLVSYYIISSGFRVITGICVISIGGTLGYLFLSLFVLKYSHWDNLLPIFTHSFFRHFKIRSTVNLQYDRF
ncbi:GerAB/ArcD/ProY family transporter [Bacillus paranthracis]